jgi:Cytochrome P460
VIMGNPVMIDAYRQGVPGNGQAFPRRAKMAKIHSIPKKQETYPGHPTVPGTQHDVDFMVKDRTRIRTLFVSLSCCPPAPAKS